MLKLIKVVFLSLTLVMATAEAKPDQNKMLTSAIGFAMCAGAVTIAGNNGWKENSSKLLKASIQSFEAVEVYWPELKKMKGYMPPKDMAMKTFRESEKNFKTERKALIWASKNECETTMLALAKTIITANLPR